MQDDKPMSGGPGVGSSNLPAPTNSSKFKQALLRAQWQPCDRPTGGGERLMGNGVDAEQPARLRAIARELEAMSDWELERGLASSLGFDDNRRMVANCILRERYAGTERGIALWVLAVAVGAGVIALLE
jgi:hypothetical protein